MRRTASMTPSSTAPMAPAIPHIPGYEPAVFMSARQRLSVAEQHTIDAGVSGSSEHPEDSRRCPAVSVGVARADGALVPLAISQEERRLSHDRVLIGPYEIRGAGVDSLLALGLLAKDEDRLLERRRLFL